MSSVMEHAANDAPGTRWPTQSASFCSSVSVSLIFFFSQSFTSKSVTCAQVAMALAGVVVLLRCGFVRRATGC